MTSDAAATDDEERLAVILSDVADAVCRGEIVDLETVCAENPELSGELRRLWGALLVTDTAGAIADEVRCHSSDTAPPAMVVYGSVW